MGLIIGILVVGIGILLIVRSRQSQAPRAKRPLASRPVKSTATSKFHAVSISCSSTACDAARALVDTRTLSEQAPLLPLPECDAVECACRFVHHTDRRRRDDRRDEFRQGLGGETGKFMKERRRRRDRRDSDSDDNF